MWYWPARNAALRLMRERSPHAMVSVSPGFTAALVALAVHRYVPSCRWIVDIGDPFSLATEAMPNNFALYGRLNRRVEGSVLSGATAVAFTTPQTAARYAAAFPESASKLRVIPPLLSLPKPAPAPFDDRPAVRFVYIGTLYAKLREPGLLLQAIAFLVGADPRRRYELHLFGDTRDFSSLLSDWQRRLGGALRLHGVVDRQTVAGAIGAADVLVNIGNSTLDQLPSKVVEYAATGKPILNLAYHEQDASAAFLSTYPDQLTLLHAGDALTTWQQAELTRFTDSLPRAIAPERLQAWLQPYLLTNIAGMYAELFE